MMSFRLILILAVIPALMQTACRRDSSADGAAEKEATTRSARPDYRHLPRVAGKKDMNVLLVSVDTTRADYLACYGHEKVKTPHIDRFAAEGARFEWCISSAPLTLVSHSTMLTGSFQYVHGARDNGMFELSDANVSVAELFKEAGYKTGAEVATVILDPKYGLTQGFDVYGKVVDQRELAKLREFGDLDAQDAGEKELALSQELDRKAGDITDSGIAHLREYAGNGKPFFLFLHYYDPHWPHEAPEEITKQYDDPYLGEITYFDQQFGRLLAEVESLGLAEDTLVILVSDHGEGKGQHGEYTHSCFLYDSTLHVPCIMRCKGTIPAGLVVKSQVRLVDLAPTILEFVGLQDRQSPQMQGVSLLPMLADPSLDLKLAAYADTISPKTMYNYSPLRTIRTADWKYILAPRPELYHVEQDRLELFNLATSDADRAIRMRQAMWDFIADSPVAPGGTRVGMQNADAATLDQLRALGYVCSMTDLTDFSSGSELDHFEPSGPNPHDFVESIELLSSALGSLRFARYDNAERQFRRFLSMNPGHALALSSLGTALIAQDKWEEAAEVYRQSVEAQSEASDEYRKLGLVFMQLGKFADAESCLSKGLALAPGDFSIKLNLASVFSMQGRHDEALRLLSEAQEASPKEPTIRYQKGVVHLRMQKTDDAIAAFKEALGLDPKLMRAHAAIAIALRDAGRVDEALDYLNLRIEENPRQAILHFQKAMCLSAKGDTEAAGSAIDHLVTIDPENPEAHVVQATSLLSRGRTKDAIAAFRKAIVLGPDATTPRLKLAGALEVDGQLDEALKVLEEVIAKWPDQCEAFRNASNIAGRINNESRAIEILQSAMKTCEQNPNVLNDLAWRLATSKQSQLRDGPRAVELARKASAITEDDNPFFLDTLGAAYAEAGDFEKALSSARRARQIAAEHNMKDVDADIATRISLYESRKPFRE